MAIPAAWQNLLDTGRYETYTDASGGTQIRLKKTYQTNNITPVKTETITPSIPAKPTTPAVTTPTSTASTSTVTAPATTTPTTKSYKIKYGDTLSQLAKDNNTTVAAIMAANPSIKDANKIYAGASLNIPAKSITPVAPVTPVAPKIPTTPTTPGATATPATPATPTFNEDNLQGYLDNYMNELLKKNQEITNFNQNYTPETSKGEYLSEITNYITSLLQEQQNTAAANAQKARTGVLTDADIAKQELDDAYTQQLAELANQADEIRAAYSSGKRNVDTQNAETLDTIAAKADEVVKLYEQGKNELEQNKLSSTGELDYSADKIKNAYSTAKSGIESEKAKTLPTYDTAMNQQDILAQRQAKQLEDEFAQRGLGAGGQVASELGQAGQTNLSEIGGIAKQKQSYISDVANKLSGVEQEQATGLADVERKKTQINQEYANKINEIESNKTMSLAEMERLKAQAAKDYQNALANLEQQQATGLTGVARAGSTAAQSLSSGKMAIIKKVNAALNNLTTDEQTLLDNLAEQRTQMLYDANQSYKDLSKEEKDAEFDRLLQQSGVAADSVSAIRTLIDDVNEAKTAALEYQIKELEMQNMSNTQKMEIEKLKQDIKLGNISAAQAAEQIKLQRDKFEFDKQQTLLENDKEEEITDDDRTIAIEADLRTMTAQEAYDELKNNQQDYVTDIGPSNYNKLLAEYAKLLGI